MVMFCAMLYRCRDHHQQFVVDDDASSPLPIALFGNSVGHVLEASRVARSQTGTLENIQLALARFRAPELDMAALIEVLVPALVHEAYYIGRKPTLLLSPASCIRTLDGVTAERPKRKMLI